MAANKTSFKKGDERAGRTKGTPNKVTETARELFVKIMEKQVPDVEAALNALKEKPKEYLDCWSKLAPYFMPKMVDITSKGESLNPIVIDWSGNNKTDSETDRGSQGSEG